MPLEPRGLLRSSGPLHHAGHSAETQSSCKLGGRAAFLPHTGQEGS